MAEPTTLELLEALQADSQARDNSADDAGATQQQDAVQSHPPTGVSAGDPSATAELQALIERQRQQIAGSQQEFQTMRQEMKQLTQTNAQLLEALQKLASQGAQMTQSQVPATPDTDPQFQRFAAIQRKKFGYDVAIEDLRDEWQMLHPAPVLTEEVIERKVTERLAQHEDRQTRFQRQQAALAALHPEMSQPQHLQKVIERYVQLQQQGGHIYAPDTQGEYQMKTPDGKYTLDTRLLNDAAYQIEIEHARSQGRQEEAKVQQTPVLTPPGAQAPSEPVLSEGMMALLSDPRMDAVMKSTYGLKDPRAVRSKAAKLFGGA